MLEAPQKEQPRTPALVTVQLASVLAHTTAPREHRIERHALSHAQLLQQSARFTVR